MSAEIIFQECGGDTPWEAFNHAVDACLYAYGHSGYTGTLAEKDCFTEIDVPDGVDPREYAQSLIDDGDGRVDDKWGPAGCVQLHEGLWLFFGLASS